MIRVLRLPDLVGVAMFLRRDGTAELTSHTWPRVQPEAGHLPIGCVDLADARDVLGAGLGLLVRAGQSTALSSLGPRAGGLVWDVEHLLIGGWTTPASRSSCSRRSGSTR